MNRSNEAPVSLRSFLGESILYGAADVGNKLIGFLFLPITTAILSPAEYGLLQVFGTWSNAAIIVFALGMPFAYLRMVTESTDINHKRSLLDTSFAIATGWSAAWIAVLCFFAAPLQATLFEIPGSAYIILLAAIAYLRFIDALGRSRLQAEGRVWTFLNISCASVGLIRGLALALIILKFGPMGWVVGEILGLIATAGMIGVFSLRGLGTRWNALAARDLVAYGVGLLPGMLSHCVMAGADKILLQKLLVDGLDQTGYYGVGERMSAAMNLVAMSFILGWRRFAFRNMHHPDGPRLLGIAVTLYVGVAGYAALAIILVGDDLMVGFINSRFLEGIKTIAPLTLACVVAGLADLLSIGLHKDRNTLLLSAITLCAGGVDILLNWITIPRFGILGAAYTTLASQILRTVVTYMLARGGFRIQFEWRRLAALVAGLAIAFAVGRFFAASGQAASFLAQSAILLATPLVFLATPLPRPEERQLLREIAGGVFARIWRSR